MSVRGARTAAAAVAAAIATLAAVASAAAPDRCAELTRMVRATYNFRPSKLSDAEQVAKSKEMDAIWKLAKANPTELSPCLETLIAAPQSDAFFRFDGAGLLVKLSPSPASKRLQARVWSDARLEDVDLRYWVETLARLGAEGFDVSRAGRRWLTEPDLTYVLAEHGGYEVGRHDGAVFLFGSMDEAAARPALIEIARDPKHPGRLTALWLLLRQATPEAVAALRSLPLDGLPPEPRSAVEEAIAERPPSPPARPSKPTLSRAALLAAFAARARDDRDAYDKLVTDPRFVERAQRVLLPGDEPQVRELRRKLVSRCNQHGIVDYILLSGLIAAVPRP